MLHIYGDSHADFSFRDLNMAHQNHRLYSITMHRIGRDRIIPNFDPRRHTPNDILCFVYGEIDCRCHIQRQIDAGRDEDQIIQELVTKYVATVRNVLSITGARAILLGVIPPTEQAEYERLNGPITHEFPFVGTDADRVRYTRKVNALLSQLSSSNEYTYLYPYGKYERENGTLKYEYSDNLVHLGKGHNGAFLDEFYASISNNMSSVSK